MRTLVGPSEGGQPAPAMRFCDRAVSRRRPKLKFSPLAADPCRMGKRFEALELARFLAFDGQDVDAIARALQMQFDFSERDAKRMALNVVAPPPDPPPGPASVDASSLFPPY